MTYTKKLRELTQEELDGMDADALRTAYSVLLRHHVDETTELYARMKEYRDRLLDLAQRPDGFQR